MSGLLVGSLGAMLAVMVVKTLVLVVGAAITYFAFSAYRRTRRRELGYLAVGFGIVTLGLVLAGMLTELLAVPLAVGILLESVLVLVGFVVIAYSMYVQ